jgi:intracellular septation protein A
MQTSALFLTLVPLIVFVVIDLFGSMKAAVVSAVAVSCALVGYFYFAFNEFDYSMVLETVLLLILGAVTLKMNNAVFFKLQPVVVGVCFALFLGWFEIFDEPYLVKIIKRMEKIIPLMEDALKNPIMLELLSRLSWQMALLFLVHAGLVAYSAIKMRDLAWILMRMAIYPLTVALALLNLYIMQS